MRPRKIFLQLSLYDDNGKRSFFSCQMNSPVIAEHKATPAVIHQTTTPLTSPSPTHTHRDEVNYTNKEEIESLGHASREQSPEPHNHLPSHPQRNLSSFVVSNLKPNVFKRKKLSREGKSKRKSLYERCKPALVLENAGSVARDHLASERTFLAYVRTSLALASSGVALVQLFALSSASSSADVTGRVRGFARPLGATTVFIGLLVLLIGTFVTYK